MVKHSSSAASSFNCYSVPAAEGSKLLTSNLSNKRHFQSFELNCTKMTLLSYFKWNQYPWCNKKSEVSSPASLPE